MSEQKRAAWSVPLDVIALALMLPEGVEVELILQTTSDAARRRCELVLVGDGLPASCSVSDGSDPVEIHGRYIDQHGRATLYLYSPGEDVPEHESGPETIRIMSLGTAVQEVDVVCPRGQMLQCQVVHPDGSRWAGVVRRGDVLPDDLGKFDRLLGR